MDWKLKDKEKRKYLEIESESEQGKLCQIRSHSIKCVAAG